MSNKMGSPAEKAAATTFEAVIAKALTWEDYIDQIYQGPDTGADPPRKPITLARKIKSRAAPFCRGGSFDFLGLPSEIRVMVYELLFIDGLQQTRWPHPKFFNGEDVSINFPKRFVDDKGTPDPIIQPAIARVCKETRKESLPVFYAVPRVFKQGERNSYGEIGLNSWMSRIGPNYAGFVTTAAIIRLVVVSEYPVALIVTLRSKSGQLPRGQVDIRFQMPSEHCLGMAKIIECAIYKSFNKWNSDISPLEYDETRDMSLTDVDVFATMKQIEHFLSRLEVSCPSPGYWAVYAKQQKKQTEREAKRLKKLKHRNVSRRVQCNNRKIAQTAMKGTKTLSDY